MSTEIERLDAAVDAFASEMKSKLRSKAAAGWDGWDHPGFYRGAIDGAFSHLRRLDRGDPAQAVDVANFMMFSWNIVAQRKER